MIALVVLLGSALICHGASWGNYSSVYDSIFSNYNLNLRPVLDDSTTLNVSVSFSLLSLDALSERDMTMTTNGWISMSWVDEILTWDYAAFGDVYEILVQQKNIWKPDIVVKNSVKKPAMLGFNEQPVSIYYDGAIIWAPGDVYETSCDLIVTYYPFDTQTCTVTVYLWLSLASEIRLVSSRTNVSLEYFSENGQWEVVSTSANSKENANPPEMTFTLKLKRRQIFYVVNIVIPIVFLSCLGPLVFALPADSGEKMGFCVTVLLAYTVFLTIIGDSMPQTSTQTSILSVYLSAMLALSALSVVLSTFVLKLYHKPEDKLPSKMVQKICHGLRKILCLTSNSNNIVRPITVDKPALDEGFESHRKTSLGSLVDIPEELSWKKVAETLDVMFLVLFTVVTVLVSTVCLVIMAVGAP